MSDRRITQWQLASTLPTASRKVDPTCRLVGEVDGKLLDPIIGGADLGIFVSLKPVLDRAAKVDPPDALAAVEAGEEVHPLELASKCVKIFHTWYPHVNVGYHPISRACALMHQGCDRGGGCSGEPNGRPLYRTKARAMALLRSMISPVITAP